jgi:hypothetical protein
MGVHVVLLGSLNAAFLRVVPLACHLPRTRCHGRGSVNDSLVMVQCAKAWCLDRMVLLFDDMKGRRPEYAAWEY